MEKRKITIALGGNALGNNLPEQMEALKGTSKAIADLIEEGHQVTIAHGNGPQVGMIQEAMSLLSHENPEKYEPCPLSVCTAMSQGYIGYDLQNSLREELYNRGIGQDVATVLTQIAVDKEDPAFKNPTKPIGAFMSKELAEKMRDEKGYDIMEDAGRGYRRVVASPMPAEIVEISTIKALVDTGHVVVAAGGGGIPVIKTGDNHLQGAAAVIDKDFASELLAESLDCDTLVILTAVEKACINFGKPEQKELGEITVAEAEQYIKEGHFAAGSMLPKVEAAVKFVKSKPGRRALITMLSKARDGINGKTGTVIVS